MNATFKPLVVAAALVAAFSATTAQAATKDAGVVSTNAATPTVVFFNPAAGDFFDKLNFTVSGPSVLSVSANNLPSKLNNTPVLGINELGFTLWTGATGSSGSSLLGSFQGNDTTVTFDLLSGGAYHFNITGTAFGVAGGFYGVAMSAAPVPEPETYAMLLAGLGMLGFMARRRMAS